MTPLRVVFDTNAFDPSHFDLLVQGPMRKLCRAGRIVPIYGHVFVEETLRAYGNERKREDLVNRWLPFIVGTTDRICNDFFAIWHEELVQGRGPKTRILMPRRDYERFIARLPSIPLDGSWRAWHTSKPVRDIEDGKRAAQRKVSASMRKAAADWRKAVCYAPKKYGLSRLDEYFEKEVDRTGRELLPVLVKCKDPHAIMDRWSRAKAQYPYFTTFVINMLYITYHAMTKVNDGIDLNAQADLHLMTHLLRADVLVSNETGFLRTAVEDIWQPRGKVIFTSQQFADFIAKL
jgi:hypothetical protein